MTETDAGDSAAAQSSVKVKTFVVGFKYGGGIMYSGACTIDRTYDSAMAPLVSSERWDDFCDKVDEAMKNSRKPAKRLENMMHVMNIMMLALFALWLPFAAQFWMQFIIFIANFLISQTLLCIFLLWGILWFNWACGNCDKALRPIVRKFRQDCGSRSITVKGIPGTSLREPWRIVIRMTSSANEFIPGVAAPAATPAPVPGYTVPGTDPSYVLNADDTVKYDLPASYQS